MSGPVPPRPAEIIPEESDCQMRYQGMTELPAEEYRRLAEDIRERGVLQPIIVDEDKRIIDGHHREALAQHFDLDESKQPAYLMIGDLDGDGEKLARGIKQNLIGRDTTDAVKSKAVKQYIETAWDRTDGGDLIRPETDTEVAEKLGVSRQLVSRVCKNANCSIITHDRIEARRYYEDNPDASYREVGRQVDASNKTVTEWLKEDFDEGDDEPDEPAENILARDTTEVEKAAEVKQAAETDAATDGGTAAETAADALEDLTAGTASPQSASKRVEKAAAEKAVEQQRKTDGDGGPPELRQSDAGELLAETDTADLLLTDPPYTTDIDDVRAFAESWLPAAIETVADGGCAFVFVGAYSDELQAYLNVLDECGVRDRTQVLVWTYRNTLGRAPNTEYKLNWQAILFIQSDPAIELDAPLTNERWAVQDINAPDGRHDGRHHKWEKPTEVVERFIRHTTEPGDTVLDPFVGTGTTALVASDLDREVVAGDNSAEMLAIAEERGCAVNE